MSIHVCTRCGKEFEYSGNVKRCPDCRFTCELCGKQTDYSNLCDMCREKTNRKKRKMVKCKVPDCNNLIRYDPKRSGYCREHTDWSGHAKRLAEHNRKFKSKPEYLKYKSERIPSIPTVCGVCGKHYLATPGAYRKAETHCCSPHCVGVNAALKTPKKDTSIEQAIEQALVERKWSYQKQVPLCGITVADFYLPTYDVVIYCDGEYWHSDSESIERDTNQNAILKSSGYQVYRFTEAEIRRSPHDCLDQIDLSKEPLFRQLSLPNA